MKRWLPILIFAVFGYYLVGANFQARLGMIDDHEIPLFLGSHGKIGLTEIPKVIAGTEIGRWGTYQRFRPVYYTLRVIETDLWRDNAFYWYGFRYLLLIASLYLVWLIASRFFPKLIAYLLVFYMMTFSFWPDLLARLGPSEIYAVPALFAFVYGLLTDKLWLTILGYVIAVGSKENFVILLPFLILPVMKDLRKKKLTTSRIIIYIVLILFTAWIAVGIYLGTKNIGADVYGTSISYVERLARIYQYKRYIVESRHLQIPLLVGLVGIVVAIKMFLKEGLKKAWSQPLTQHLIFVGVLLAMIASQYLFYNSNFPTNMRYDFPIMLLFPTLQLTALLVLLELWPKRHKAAMKLLINLGIVAGLGYFIFTRGFDHIRIATKRNAVATSAFAAKIEQISPVLKANSKIPLIFATQNPLDYEPVISVSRYLQAGGINNQFMVQYDQKEKTDDPQKLELAYRFDLVMRGQPDPDQIFGRFTKTTSPVDGCYSLTFSGAKTPWGCEQLASF